MILDSPLNLAQLHGPKGPRHWLAKIDVTGEHLRQIISPKAKHVTASDATAQDERDETAAAARPNRRAGPNNHRRVHTDQSGMKIRQDFDGRAGIIEQDARSAGEGLEVDAVWDKVANDRAGQVARPRGFGGECLAGRSTRGEPRCLHCVEYACGPS
jgi:hypothetical protein